MKYLSFIILLFFYQNGVSQKIEEGLYVNEKSNEFLYLYQDSIKFRLYNYDSFGAFTIGAGLYKSKGQDRFFIEHNESIKVQTSYIRKYQRNDSLITISVKYNDSTPVQSAYAYIKEDKKDQNDFEFVGISDADGMIIFPEKIIETLLTKNEFTLKIDALGFATEKSLFLERGIDFIVYSQIPIKYPFVISNSVKFTIKTDGLEGIVIEISRKKKERKRYGSSKLTKVETKTFPTGFLFDKDVAKILSK